MKKARKKITQALQLTEEQVRAAHQLEDADEWCEAVGQLTTKAALDIFFPLNGCAAGLSNKKADKVKQLLDKLLEPA